MPYKVKKVGGAKPFAVVNTQTGKIVGRSKTKELAAASARARYAAIGRKGERK